MEMVNHGCCDSRQWASYALTMQIAWCVIRAFAIGTTSLHMGLGADVLIALLSVPSMRHLMHWPCRSLARVGL